MPSLRFCLERLGDSFPALIVLIIPRRYLLGAFEADSFFCYLQWSCASTKHSLHHGEQTDI